MTDPMDPLHVVRRNIEEVQNRGNFAAFEVLFADTFVDHTPQRGIAPTKDGVRTLYQGLRTAMPDFRADIHWQTREDDKVTTFKTYHGTHHGQFLGIAPTGRSIQFHALDVFRVDNGQLTDHWGIADLLSVLVQLDAFSSDTAL